MMGVLYGISALSVLAFMVVLFTAAQIMKDNSIVDIGWGMGFVIIAFSTFFYEPGFDARQLLILVLVCAWGFRLAGYLLARARGQGEDFRYANFRKQWGRRAVVTAFFRVFMFQGAVMLIIAYPVIRIQASEGHGLDALAYIGLAVWIAGFLFQSIGDAQLRTFKKTRTSKEDVLKSGLWRYSRHPNYFGEAVMWWGIALIALPVPGGWLSLGSALLMNVLLLKVSGVPFLEKRYKENPAYQQYKRETNRFIPWFPKTPGEPEATSAAASHKEAHPAP